MGMNQWQALAKLAQGFRSDEARHVPRFAAHGAMQCEPAGAVQDFSSTGVRVHFRKNPKLSEGDEFDLRLMTPKGDFTTRVRIQWIRKCSRKMYEAGLAFVDPEAAKAMNLCGVLHDALLESDWLPRKKSA